MAQSTQSATRRKATTQDGWEPPYDDFPLSYHPPSGRLYKKIRGKRFYFGYASDWEAATEKFANEKDDLFAGRTPRATGDGLTVKDLCNRFLTAKTHALNAGEITNRTFLDYKASCDRLIENWKARLVDDLAADDFASLRASIATKRGPVALGNEIQRIRTVFKFAYDNGLVSNAIRYGSAFQKPAKKVLRKAKAENGKRLFEASEIRLILDAVNPTLKAMVLLGVNCAFGNSDCASLPLDSIDLESEMIDYPRPKTGVQRRCPLWRETAEAVRAAIESRPEPKGGENANLAFLSPGGSRWVYDNHNPLAKEVRRLLIELGIKRPGLSFYTLRHTFRTIADETRDFPAIDLIMGHSDNTMGGNYRERIGDDRLRAVVDHVRTWLYGKPEADGGEDAEANEADVQDDRPQLRVVG